MIGLRFGRRLQDRRRFLRRVGTFAGYLGFFFRGPFRRNALAARQALPGSASGCAIIAPAVRFGFMEQRADRHLATGPDALPHVARILVVERSACWLHASHRSRPVSPSSDLIAMPMRSHVSRSLGQ